LSRLGGVGKIWGVGYLFKTIAYTFFQKGAGGSDEIADLKS